MTVLKGGASSALDGNRLSFRGYQSDSRSHFDPIAPEAFGAVQRSVGAADEIV